MAATECLFCKIVAKEIQSEMVYEDEGFVVIKDINPAAPIHLLLIPKVHIASLNEATIEDLDILGNLQLLAARMAVLAGIAGQGYRLVNNVGKWGGQTINHLHYHLLGGKQLGWPPE
ncbi:MAG: histidine triad nucleotide-binding protein [Firmicutes bacterium]|nr:histidine triad nucleotide-binding protein [Bacillota bacterium]